MYYELFYKHSVKPEIYSSVFSAEFPIGTSFLRCVFRQASDERRWSHSVTPASSAKATASLPPWRATKFIWLNCPAHCSGKLSPLSNHKTYLMSHDLKCTVACSVKHCERNPDNHWLLYNLQGFGREESLYFSHYPW